jgi:iron complex outermembrane receptor protein
MTSFCRAQIRNRRFDDFILLALSLLLLSVDVVSGADAYVLKGQTIRADSKEPVPGASVRLLEAGNRTVTDGEGWFALEPVNSGRHTLVISHPQYIEQRIIIQVPAAADLEIQMQPPLLYHETVTVTAAPWAVDRADVAQSANVLDTAEVRVRAGLSVGEAISSLPGVRSISTGEAGGAPMIRGQSNERIRVLSNGFPHDY